jgi:hypothetical protein
MSVEDEVFVGDESGTNARVSELADDFGVWQDVPDLLSNVLELREGILAFTLAWVLSVQAEGGALQAGIDSTKARKGIGWGASICWIRRESCLPRCIL